jgi:hypothetical protein
MLPASYGEIGVVGWQDKKRQLERIEKSEEVEKFVTKDEPKCTRNGRKVTHLGLFCVP